MKTGLKYKMSRNRRHSEMGLCTRCRSIPVPGNKMCEKHIAESKRYTVERKDKISAYKKTIRHLENARKRTEAYKAKRNKLRRERKRSDPSWAMVDRLRKRIGRAVRDRLGSGRKKAAKTQELIGCTVAELMVYIERQFLPGMTWSNRSLWHIDHKRPCASFNLLDPEQQKACFHYTNLQPLWAVDNIRKHAKCQHH